MTGVVCHSLVTQRYFDPAGISLRLLALSQPPSLRSSMLFGGIHFRSACVATMGVTLYARI
jgi:hypothetical protein